MCLILVVSWEDANHAIRRQNTNLQQLDLWLVISLKGLFLADPGLAPAMYQKEKQNEQLERGRNYKSRTNLHTCSDIIDQV